MGLYRVVREDGSVEYTDVPSGSGQMEAVRPGSTRADDEARRREDAKTAETLIREAQKRIPKVTDYLDYLEYLRHNSPVRFNRVMDELRREDPQTWLKLQKYPQFRLLRETALGLKAGSNLLGAGVGLATGKFTGSVEKWMESTLKDLMKRDRFGPYADVLGTKASTLPTKATTYSNSRLGQYLKVEDARLAAASRAAAKELEQANAGLRSARGTAVVRGVGPVMDFGIAALNPDTAESMTNILMRRRLDRLARSNPAIDLGSAAYEQAHQLLSEGRYGELDKLLKQYE
jgi:hypothetical protein